MAMFDGILGNLGSLDELAAKLGMPAESIPALLEQLAADIGSGKPGVTALAETAAAHGVSADALQEALAGLGGPAGILGSATGFLDRDGDGNPLNELSGLAKGLFG
ncbi:MAG: hypothetical protein QHC67_07590 [Sphingobium sp.]|uniref:hypothetical protein n=1 Tax=Sphingobium sp. TaxID=1912891 RepID=UPI0029AC55BC|nr:hypothetical protein [Sphingobium sp.]MDX3909667.1 hypothetical protein [Sphingobium sp.]